MFPCRPTQLFNRLMVNYSRNEAPGFRKIWNCSERRKIFY